MNLHNLREKLQEKGIDALIVTDELNQRYLLNYPFTDGMLLITQKSAYMITDFRYREEAEKCCDPAFQVVTPDARVPFIQEVLDGDKARTIGFEDTHVTVAEFRRMEDFYKEFTLVPAGGLLESIREIKLPEEIEYMKKAQSITDAAFSHILKVLTPNMTETEVALELEFEMRRLGADGIAFETIAVSGDASALPHGHPRNEKLHSGFLTMDYGASYHGYCSDMTRTVVIGRADEDMRRLYHTVLRAQTEAMDAIRAGAECASVDKIARDIIDGNGYLGCFGHSLGHGVGLFIHENPRLASRAVGEYLKAGNVVTNEPGIYLAGKYGCRIEDMVLVAEDGYYDFTQSSKEMIEIL